MNLWNKVIPEINLVFLAISLALIFLLDLGIVISDPSLLPFLYIMLAVLAVFVIFVALENYVLRKKFITARARQDKAIAVVIVFRNIIFILNFLPYIQLIGLAAIVYIGWIIMIVYIVLIILRFESLNKSIRNEQIDKIN